VAYRNKIYVAFDGDEDIHYYYLMKAWKQHDDISFSFNDAHDLTQSRDSSTEETIKRSLRTRLVNSKVFILLIGEKTKYLRKFVRWEIEQALSLKLPIICVNLNGKKSQDADLCPALLRDELAIHISFKAGILEHALENWPATAASLTKEKKVGPYYYKDDVYSKL